MTLDPRAIGSIDDGYRLAAEVAERYPNSLPMAAATAIIAAARLAAALSVTLADAEGSLEASLDTFNGLMGSMALELTQRVADMEVSS